VDTATLYVDASANRVGIGTTSPNEKLDVRGRIEVQETTDPSQAGSGLGTIYANSSNSKLYYRDDTGQNYDLTSTATTSDGSWTNSGAVTYLTDSGDKVGIGTSTPQGFLSVEKQFPSSSTLGFTVSDPRYEGLFQFKTNSSSFFLPALEGYSGTETTVPVGIMILGAIDDSEDVFLNNWGTVVVQGREYVDFPNDTPTAVENADIFTVNNYPSTAYFRVAADGGIFAPSLKDTTGVSANMYYNTVSDELMYITSSERYKTNIRDYDRGINDLMKLRPVYFQPKNSKNNNIFNTGFIAEEVEETGMVEYIDYDENGRANSIHYALMTSLLTKAIQEQQAIIESQATEIEQLKTLITELSNRLTILENN
jgi:hypothetical protein